MKVFKKRAISTAVSSMFVATGAAILRPRQRWPRMPQTTGKRSIWSV